MQAKWDYTYANTRHMTCIEISENASALIHFAENHSLPFLTNLSLTHIWSSIETIGSIIVWCILRFQRNVTLSSDEINIVCYKDYIVQHCIVILQGFS